MNRNIWVFIDDQKIGMCIKNIEHTASHDKAGIIPLKNNNRQDRVSFIDKTKAVNTPLLFKY